MERRPSVLMLRLKESGLVVPSRETVRRWAQKTHSPSSSVQIFNPRPSEELGFFLGAWLGDGWADENDGGKRLLMMVRSPSFAEEFAKSSSLILAKKRDYRVRVVQRGGKNWYLVKVTSILLYEFVPKPWEQLSDFAVAYPVSFLRGFFTAEGTLRSASRPSNGTVWTWVFAYPIHVPSSLNSVGES